jgi:hypothetical protein
MLSGYIIHDKLQENEDITHVYFPATYPIYS